MLLIPARLQVIERFQRQLLRDCPGLELDLMKPNRRLAAFCEEEGIPLCDPTDAFVQAAKRGSRLYFEFEDAHWTAEGNALAAKEVAPFIAPLRNSL
jgi:lysophospholipase L1-like esterase